MYGRVVGTSPYPGGAGILKYQRKYPGGAGPSSYPHNEPYRNVQQPSVSKYHEQQDRYVNPHQTSDPYETMNDPYERTSNAYVTRRTSTGVGSSGQRTPLHERDPECYVTYIPNDEYRRGKRQST